MIWTRLRRLLAAWIMPERVFQADTYGVPVEILRPSGRGINYHIASRLDLPVDLLNAIFDEAYSAMPDAPGGDISCVRLEIVAPGMAVLAAPMVPLGCRSMTLSTLATVQAEAAPRRDERVVRLAPPKGPGKDSPEGERVWPAQPTLFDTGEPDEACDHEFDAEGFCWKCNALQEVEEADPYEFLAERLTQAGQGPKKTDKRLDLAVEIYDHLVTAGVDGDDLDGVWQNWDLFYAPLYERVVGSSCDPQNAADRLTLIEEILDLAERKGIPADSPVKVWEHFAMSYKASWTVMGGKRKLVITPLPASRGTGKVKAPR